MELSPIQILYLSLGHPKTNMECMTYMGASLLYSSLLAADERWRKREGRRRGEGGREREGGRRFKEFMKVWSILLWNLCSRDLSGILLVMLWNARGAILN